LACRRKNLFRLKPLIVPSRITGGNQKSIRIKKRLLFERRNLRFYFDKFTELAAGRGLCCEVRERAKKT
jgi:hypothetical protein